MRSRRFTIEPDIAAAATPPAWIYHDPAVYDCAVERVFARSWQLVADAADVSVPQHVHPFTFLAGCVNEPLVLTRDTSDHLHCLSNVCTHRGNLVAQQPCRAAHLRCAYHGRRFGLDGRFESMPEFEQARDFPSDADHLPAVAHDRWGPWIFVALDPAAAFDATFGPLRARTEGLGLDALRFDAARSRDYLVEANWALYCDNYLEGFHIPFVHASLNAELSYTDYRTELFPFASLQVGVSSGGGHVLDLPPDSPDAGQEIAAYYFWVFPNLMFNVYPWGCSVNIVTPLGPQRTRVSFRAYVGDASRLDQGAGAELDRVEREDEAVVESVQQGVRSRLYDRGRYSPTREQAVHHFHRLLAEHLDLT